MIICPAESEQVSGLLQPCSRGGPHLKPDRRDAGTGHPTQILASQRHPPPEGPGLLEEVTDSRGTSRKRQDEPGTCGGTTTEESA